MCENQYNIIKAASWYTIGNILIKGVSFFVLPIFTTLMSTHEYGIYSVYLSFLMIFETFILLGLSSTVAIARYAHEVEFESYMSTILAVPLALTVLCMLIINAYIPKFGNILSMDSILWNCLLVTSAAGAIGGIIGARLVLDGRYVIYILYSVIGTIGNVGCSLLLCYTVFFDHDVHLARIYGSTAASVVSAMFLLIATKTQISIIRVNLKYAVIWGIPLLFHTVATVLLTQSDKILIRYMDSYSSAGIYAVATTVVTIPMVLQQSLHQAWVPWFYKKLDSKDYQQIRWLNNRYIIFYGIVIASFMLITPDLIHIITEKSYWGCIYSLVPLAISVFGELLYGIPISVEYFNKKATYIMTATVIAVVTNIFMDILFISLFGYHGAAYATTVSKIILFLMHYYCSRKLDLNDVFSWKIVIGSIILLSILDAVIVITLEWVIIRYVLLSIFVATMGQFILKNRKKLRERLRKQ